MRVHCVCITASILVTEVTHLIYILFLLFSEDGVEKKEGEKT